MQPCKEMHLIQFQRKKRVDGVADCVFVPMGDGGSSVCVCGGGVSTLLAHLGPQSDVISY